VIAGPERWELGLRPAIVSPTSLPNTNAQLESFYAVPQLGAVLVPINYRLTADDFVYLIETTAAQDSLCARGLP
jgi:fatty-acyl-CoA synthase